MTSPENIVVPEWMQPMYDAHHFAPAVIDGDHLRCSGMMGLRPDLTLPAEPLAQFTLAFENLRGLLAEAGLTFADVVDIDYEDRTPFFGGAGDRVDEIAINAGLAEILS